MAHTLLTAGQRGAELLLTSGKCPVRSGGRHLQIKCSDPNCKVRIDQDDKEDVTLCHVGATKSFSGYGRWLCCNHAKIEGWAGYDEAACAHCRIRAAAFNKYTGMAKTVKGVPQHHTRPTSGWSHGKGKAKKRLLLHNKRLETQNEPNPAASLTRRSTLSNKSPTANGAGHSSAGTSPAHEAPLESFSPGLVQNVV